MGKQQAETWLLYSRPECHLCEVAGAMLEASGVRWRYVDIEPELNLVRKYGDRVPVLTNPSSGAELGWPFDAETLADFLAR